MTPSPQNIVRRGKQLWIAVLSMALGGMVLLAYVLWSAYHEARLDAENTAISHANLLEARLDTALRRVDADLAALSERVPLDALGRAAVPQFRTLLEDELARRWVKFPEIAGLRIVDAQGNVRYMAGSGDYVNIADRAYFKALRDRYEPGLIFSEVLVSRITKRPVMVAARGLYAADGSFRGIVSMPLALEYFDSLLENIDMGPNGALVIRRFDDQTLVLRRPSVADEINRPLAATHPIYQRLQAGEMAGSMEFTAQADGIQRIYAFRRLKDYPFYVLAGLSTDDVTSLWKRRAQMVAGVGIALFAGLSLMLFWLFRAQERELLAAEVLRQQELQLREAQRLAKVGSWELDLSTGQLAWSESLYQIFEIDPAKHPGTYELFISAIHPDDRESVDRAYRASLSQREPYQIEHRLLLPDGRIKYILESGETRYAEDGTPLRSIGTAQDITGMRQMEAQMQLLASAFQHSGEAILITDADNRIITVNPSFTELTGYELADVLGKNPSMLSAGRNTPEEYAAMWQALGERGFWQGEVWDRRKDGGVYPKWLSISVIRSDDGSIRYYIAHFTDISAERAVEARLHHLAHHDMLTGLVNRLNLKGRLEQALAAAEREGGRVALLFIDLDRFKVVNDTLGHHVGDELLIEVARRLLDAVRGSDVVARLGGDEFVIMLTGIEHTAVVASVAEKLVLSVGEPYLVEGHDLYTSPSIGIAIYPTDGTDGETLLKNADAAMYHAKTAGRNNFQFFDAKMNDAALERLKIEHSLRQALARDEFRLHFQPIIDMRSGRVVKLEALVRWQHPEMGLVPPARFIGIAEETGLIQPLGEWVFWAACRQQADFRAAGVTGVKMGINISALQMRNGNLPILARGAIEALGLEPAELIFEITESVAMQRPDETVRILDLLHDMGIQLAIDDFGTGYSSLSYLRMFPISYLKLDRSFVEEIGRGQGSAVICDATISLAHSLGLKLIAEGIETPEQFDYLLDKGCDQAQGYLFSRPVPADEALAFIRRHNQ